jgi:hypothetical protein
MGLSLWDFAHPFWTLYPYELMASDGPPLSTENPSESAMAPHRASIDSFSVATKDLASLFENATLLGDEPQILSISTVGNAWEPMRRWSKAESRVLRNSPSSLNRVTVADLLSLGELYGFLPIRFEATKLTPFKTGWIPKQLRTIARKLPVIKNLAKDIQVHLYKESSKSKLPDAQAITIVIPARNEAGNEPLLRDALTQIQKRLPKAEVVLVEGNSTDDTYARLKAIEADFAGTLDLQVKQQTGKGKKDAVVCGFNQCRGQLLAIIDCDFTVDINDSISAIQHAALRRCCMINCARTLYPMERDAMRWSNYIGNRLFALAVSYLSGQDISDALCGTKIFTRALYELLIADGSWLSPRDPFGDFTLIFGASNQNYRILNYPVRYFARRSGAPNISRWTDGLKLLRVCWHQLIA